MKPLTTRAVETVKPKLGKRLELADHVVRGLSLRVSAAGVMTWPSAIATWRGSRGALREALKLSPRAPSTKAALIHLSTR